MASDTQNAKSMADSQAESNFAVMDLGSGKIFHEGISEYDAKLEADRLGDGNCSHAAVKVEYVVYHEYDHSEARQEVKRFQDKEKAEQFTIDQADEYTNPNFPYQGTVEREIEIVHFAQ